MYKLMSMRRIFPTWQLNAEESQVLCSLNSGLLHFSEARAHSKKTRLRLVKSGFNKCCK